MIRRDKSGYSVFLHKVTSCVDVYYCAISFIHCVGKSGNYKGPILISNWMADVSLQGVTKSNKSKVEKSSIDKIRELFPELPTGEKVGGHLHFEVEELNHIFID